VNKVILRWSKVFIIALLMLSSASAYGQPLNRWVRFYGDRTPNGFQDVYTTADGGYVMCGDQDPDGDGGRAQPDIILVRTDREGGQQWLRLYDLFGQGNHDVGECIIEADDDGFVVGGVQFTRAGQNFIGMKVNSDGDLIWLQRYGNNGLGECHAVIETKSGDYLFGGYFAVNDDYQGYVVLADGNGEPIWSRLFNEDTLTSVYAIRERPDDGFFLAGIAQGSAALVKITLNGEVDWATTYPSDFGGSCATSLMSVEGGYALGGHVAINTNCPPRIIRVNADGQLLWDRAYGVDRHLEFYCLAKLPENGFVLVGATAWGNTVVPDIMRIGRGGNLIWERHDEFLSMGYYYSATYSPDGSVMVSGAGRDPNGRQYKCVLIKLIEDKLSPRIVYFDPPDSDLKALQGDSIRFTVMAVDDQSDSLSYYWILQQDTISFDTTVVIGFPELGEVQVRCFASDREAADSVSWAVHVRDFFIADYAPDSLFLALRRGTTQPFSLDTVRAIVGDPVEYEWTLTNLDNFESVDEGTDPFSTVEFLQSGRFQVEGLAFRGASRDNVVWNVIVRSAILDFWPRNLNLLVAPDSRLSFGVLPFNRESDSLSYRWEFEGDSVGADSTYSIIFGPEENGEGLPPHLISAIVMDGTEGDTVTWRVTVGEPEQVGKSESPKVEKWGLLMVSPNPFNSSTTIRYVVPTAGRVQLTLHDLTGREVQRLVDANLSVGSHSLTWNAGGFTSGIYIVKIETPSFSTTRKVLLVK